MRLPCRQLSERWNTILLCAVFFRVFHSVLAICLFCILASVCVIARRHTAPAK